MINFKIFPAHLNNEKQKVPLIKNWRELASNDPQQIAIWQQAFGSQIHFWGVPCGVPNGIMVLDIDIKTDGWKTIREQNLFIPDTLSQKTLNGGRHFIFKYDPTKDIGNKVGFLPGLDIRSQGGWIAWYGMDVNPNKPILDAPEWIFTATKNKPTPETVQSNVRLAPEIVEGMFAQCLENIRNAPAGESNDTLNREAYKVGQMIASSTLTRSFAEQELRRAAKDRGKPDYEAKATIESGINGGLKHPLTAPFPAQEPTPAFDIPAVPGAPERWTPSFFTREDLLNTSKLRKPQLFQDWSTEDIAITTADGGTGKTTLKLYEAVCLALGDRFLGFECKQSGKTLFITGEDTAEKLGAMIGVILKQMGLFDGSPENNAKVDTVLQSIVVKKDADLCLIAKDKQGFLYPNPDALQKLLQAIADIKPKMIVFDPIASFWGSESALNDMNKAVTKFMSDLVHKSHACVEMINHMGKSSSANKDMTMFAGRGGSGLPSNSRVSRVLRELPAEEYEQLMGKPLELDTKAIMCNVNKFSDGSPLYNVPFIILRKGYLFFREALSKAKVKEMENEMSDIERIFTFIKEMREKGKYPTEKVVEGTFMVHTNSISAARVKRALQMLQFSGHMGEKIQLVQHPQLTIRDKAIIITDEDGSELYTQLPEQR